MGNLGHSWDQLSWALIVIGGSRVADTALSVLISCFDSTELHRSLLMTAFLTTMADMMPSAHVDCPLCYIFYYDIRPVESLYYELPQGWLHGFCGIEHIDMQEAVTYILRSCYTGNRSVSITHLELWTILYPEFYPEHLQLPSCWKLAAFSSNKQLG
jgi:hypothetical protein